MRTARDLALVLAALAGAALGASGCHIVFDGARRDAQAAVEVPPTFGDSVRRDIQNYERVGEPGPRTPITQP
jgi:hypothetical protein